MEKYANELLNVQRLKFRFYQYCLEKDFLIQLKTDILKYLPYVYDEISKAALDILYNETYQANVYDNTARDEGKKIELTYNEYRTINGTRGTFTNISKIPLTGLDDQARAAIKIHKNENYH